MVTVTEIDSITGALLFGPVQRTDFIEGYDLALEVLSNHIIERDEIVSDKQLDKEIVSIRHFDGTHSYFQVVIENNGT